MVLRLARTTSVLPAAAASRSKPLPPIVPSVMPLLLSTMQAPTKPSISSSLGRVSFALAMFGYLSVLELMSNAVVGDGIRGNGVGRCALAADQHPSASSPPTVFLRTRQSSDGRPRQHSTLTLIEDSSQLI